MKLEEQVTNLELSKKLKELGVKQESEFEWYTHNNKENEAWVTNDPGEYATFGDELIASAFTVAELGEMLPDSIEGDEGMKFDLDIWRDRETKGYVISYWWDEDTRKKSDMQIQSFESKSLADAMAKMLIYFLENKLIAPLHNIKK